MTTIFSPEARKGLLCSLLVSFVLSANHYCRDAPGTVEEQLRNDPQLAVSPSRYALLTAIYFTPSTIVPLALGLISSVYGISSVVIFHSCAWLGVVGNAITGVGGAKGSFTILLVGRGIAGTVYEAVDMMPLAFVPQMLPGRLWPTCSGLLNGILRLGSVAAFLTLPSIYEQGEEKNGDGTSSVFIAVAVVGGIMGPLASAVWFLATGKANECFEENKERSTDTSSSGATEIETQESCDSMPSTEKEKVTERGDFVATLKSVPRTFWVYSFVGTAMYASVIPFWFYGSGYLQRSRGLSLKAADSMMVFPEGAICVLSAPTGLLINYFKLGFVGQQRALVVSTVCIALSHISLAIGAPATFGVVALGSSYAVSNQLFWSAFPDACPPELASLGAGIVACCINVGATFVPVLIGAIHESMPIDHADTSMLLLLAFFALVSTGVAISNSKTETNGYEQIPEV